MGQPARKHLDLLGFLCPIPVHETRRALNQCENGEILEVVCDDPETMHDIPALCDRLGVELRGVEEDAGEFTFVIAKLTGVM
tara:strand:- start:4592 stop:4837 length:246 start_codon:yes stop_codon:yes gene_type:complete